MFSLLVKLTEAVLPEDYNYTGDAYRELISEHVIEENEKVWNRISVGSITVNYKKEKADLSNTAKEE